jgi:predicted regulator of Ras-like GTPase activity (Roadblock/LC7/MglB family)
MFEFFKNLFVQRPGENPVESEVEAAPSSATQPATPKNPALSRPVQRPQSNGNGNGVHVPLQAILSGLPLELKGRIRLSEVGDATISVPLEKILSQLASGSVKISFGELRRAAPQVFARETDRDQVPVSLPLQEILARINPALLVRRQNQKQIEVPEDINSPFGDHGQGLAFAAGQERSEAPPIAPRATTPAAPPGTSFHFQPKPAPAANAPVPPPAAIPTPFRHTFSPSPIPSATPPAHPAPPSPGPFFPKSPLSAPPGLRNFVAQPVSAPAPAPAPEPMAHREPAPQAIKYANDKPSLNVPLAALAEGWPEVLRLEIVQLNLADANVSLPVETVGESLKRGRVTFPWKTLRSWIRPPLRSTPSLHDALSLELPLRVIAPLFLAHQKAAEKYQHKTEIDESIPNLFFGFPQPSAPAAEATPTPAPAAAAPPAAASPSHAVARPVDTNYYVWDDSSDSARVDESEFKRKPSPGTTFITRYATPNEVVSRAAALDGVAGALIALPDGLMVASKLSPDLNGDTLAAFLPHIFAKVSQCTKELRMGELNNLNFTVGNVPWKIFRVNAIFFAVFGRTGQPLPTPQLVALAAELDRKK